MANPLLIGALAGIGKGISDWDQQNEKIRAEQRAAEERRASMDYQSRLSAGQSQADYERTQADPLHQAQVRTALGAADYAEGKGTRYTNEQTNIGIDNARADAQVAETTAARLLREAEDTDREAKRLKAESKAAEKQAKEEAKAQAALAKASQELLIRQQVFTQQYKGLGDAQDTQAARMDLMKEVQKYPELKPTWDQLEAKSAGPGAASGGISPALQESVFNYQPPALGAASPAATIPPPSSPPSTPPAREPSWNVPPSSQNPPATVPPPADSMNVGGTPGAVSAEPTDADLQSMVGRVTNTDTGRPFASVAEARNFYLLHRGQ